MKRNENAIKNRWLLVMWVIGIVVLLITSYYVAPLLGGPWGVIAICMWVVPIIFALFGMFVDFKVFGLSVYGNEVPYLVYALCPVVNIWVGVLVVCRYIRMLYVACR